MQTLVKIWDFSSVYLVVDFSRQFGLMKNNATNKLKAKKEINEVVKCNRKLKWPELFFFMLYSAAVLKLSPDLALKCFVNVLFVLVLFML